MNAPRSSDTVYAAVDAQLHACEVAMVVRMPSKGDRAVYLAGVERHRGKPGRKRITDSLLVIHCDVAGQR